MIIKILGIFDLISGISFWLFAFFKIIPESFITIIAFYLIIKGLLFIIFKDIASILDIISGILIYLSLIIAFPQFVPILVTLFLIQKGIFSLIA